MGRQRLLLGGDACAVLAGGARARRRGSALAISLLTVMVTAALGAALLQLQMRIDRRTDFAIDRRRALYLAEAGIAEAALAVSSGRTGILASEDVPASFGNGAYWVESEDLPDSRIMLRCTAQVGSAELVLQAMVLPSVNPVTSLGIFGSEGVSIGWGSTIDGYNSDRGDYASQLDPSAPVPSTGEGGLIGSDADVLLDEPYGLNDAVSANPSHVFGRIRPGPEGSLRSSGAPQLHGSVTPYSAPPFLPEVTLPTPDEQIEGAIIVSSDWLDLGVTATTHVKGAVEVTTTATLTIEGPKTVRCTHFLVRSGAALVLDDANGPIHIYAEEGFNFESGSFLESIAPESEARGTFLRVPGSASKTSRVFLNATGTFHGALYAPDDLVIVPKTLRWIGSLVARRVLIEPGAHITIDRRLTLGSDGFPSFPERLVWQLVPLGDKIARPLAIEPLLALAVRGITPVPGSAAALETLVELQYIDQSGRSATYKGEFNSFDPSVARQIVGARWEDPRDGMMRPWVAPVGTESTGTVPGFRGELRDLRAAILSAHPDLDVAILTNAEAIAEAAAATTAANLPTQPASVRRAVQRIDGASADAVPIGGSPIGRSNRATNAANELSQAAGELLSLANNYDDATLTPGALAALERLDNEVSGAWADARRTATHAEDIPTLSPVEQEEEAERAEMDALRTSEHLAQARVEYDAFIAAL